MELEIFSFHGSSVVSPRNCFFFKCSSISFAIVRACNQNLAVFCCAWAKIGICSITQLSSVLQNEIIRDLIINIIYFWSAKFSHHIQKTLNVLFSVTLKSITNNENKIFMSFASLLNEIHFEAEHLGFFRWWKCRNAEYFPSFTLLLLYHLQRETQKLKAI